MNYFMIGGDGREYGPADAEQALQWIREGRANGDTLLRREGETEWKPLKSFPELHAQPVPPPIGAMPPRGFVDEPHDVPVLVGHSFARAWHLVGQHFGVVFGATLMVWLVFTILMLAGLLGREAGFMGLIASMMFYGPLLGGLFMVFLKLIREGNATPADMFTLTRDRALPLVLAGFVMLILTEVATICCCGIPGIYLQIAWLLALPLIADRGAGFWEGMEASRRVVTRHWFKVFAVVVVSFLPWLVFHVYMMARMGSDLAPAFQKLMNIVREAQSTGTPNQAAVRRFLEEWQTVGSAYVPWILIKQFLLLISLPFGIGSLAFVYEDLFGRKK
jgi:hypothetical protein